MTALDLVVFLLGVMAGQWLTVWGLTRLFVTTLDQLDKE